MDTAPDTDAILIDVDNVTKGNNNMFGGSSNRITIAAGAFTGTGTVDTSVDEVSAGDRLRVTVDQVGSTEPGEGCVVLLSFAIPV